MPTRVATLLAWTALLLLTPSVSSAQVGGSGSIQGTVLDTSNAAVPGATVTATHVATGIDTIRQTTAAGVYALTPLPPGQYRVTVTLDGFQPFVREGLIVDALSVIGLNVTLQVAGLTQEVVVSATAPPPLGRCGGPVTLAGFQPFVREGLIVDALSVIGLNVPLQVAGLTEGGVVSAAAPPPLGTADARLGQTIRNEVYTALPLVLNTGGP